MNASTVTQPAEGRCVDTFTSWTPWRSHNLVVMTSHLPTVGIRHQLHGLGTSDPGADLLAALARSVSAQDGVWVGAPPSEGAADAAGLDLVQVPLTAAERDGYDNGMCERALWPLHHGTVARPEFRRDWWDTYVAVNRRFADVARRQAAPNATVWVQGFGLDLVPAMLRDARPDLAIGFTSRLPFPPFEIFAQVPWRHELLAGLSGADLVGLPRPSDVANLLRAGRRCGLAEQFAPAGGGPEQTAAGAESPRPAAVQVGVVGSSVNARGLDRIARHRSVVARARRVRAELGRPRTMLLGVDPLDETRGLLQRLDALAALLEGGRLNPSDVVYVQVTLASRPGHDDELRERLEAGVARINGTYATVGHPVIHHLHQDLPAPELLALFLASDALLATPLSDGTGRIAEEYVASRHDERGVVVLSEFAGAAAELSEVLVVNPHDHDALQSAILKAATMTDRDAAHRMRVLRRTVLARDPVRLANAFLEAVAAAHRDAAPPATRVTAEVPATADLAHLTGTADLAHLTGTADVPSLADTPRRHDAVLAGEAAAR